MSEEVIRAFHRLFYDRFEQTWDNATWLGVKLLKCPFDAWVLQEILWETKPDLIVECGTRFGGSAHFFATLCDLLGHGEILTIDIDVPDVPRPAHPRITYLAGSSIAAPILAEVRARAEGSSVMVILDSDHSEAHVARELRAYGPLVTPGCYLVVEDTNLNGHPVFPAHGPGPKEAVERFLAETHDFEVDRTREKFFLTFNPGGYLRRK